MLCFFMVITTQRYNDNGNRTFQAKQPRKTDKMIIKSDLGWGNKRSIQCSSLTPILRTHQYSGLLFYGEPSFFMVNHHIILPFVHLLYIRTNLSNTVQRFFLKKWESAITVFDCNRLQSERKRTYRCKGSKLL